MTRIIADFGSHGRAVVDDQDYEALARNRYRRDSYGYVVRSVPPKGRKALARDVADLMGAGQGSVGYRDFDQLNCTRANLYLRHFVSRQGLRKAPGEETRQPQGVHRVRCEPSFERGVTSSPPPAWVLKYHPGPCDYTGDAQRCALLPQAEYMGLATRCTKISAEARHRVLDGWKFEDVLGRTYSPDSFKDGCVELIISYWGQRMYCARLSGEGRMRVGSAA